MRPPLRRRLIPNHQVVAAGAKERKILDAGRDSSKVGQMKRVQGLVMAVAWAALHLSASAKPAPEAFFVHDGDRVVFLGDSITEQRLYTTYIEAYAQTRYPKWTMTFRNVGWGGDTAWLRQRTHADENKLFAANSKDQQKMIEEAVGGGLERDVLPLKPTAVTIKFGMNDHCYQAFRKDIFGAYIRSQTELATVLQKNGARVGFITPQPIEDQRPDPEKDEKNMSLEKFSEGLKKVATEKQASFVNLFNPYMAIMRKVRSHDGTATIGGGDAVHPGPSGQTIMAWTALKGLGATGLVSSSEILVKGDFSKVGSAVQCVVTNLSSKDNTVSFDRLDDSLPLPIDGRAISALALAPIVADLSVFELKVTGLTSEKYDVSIDGEKAATVTREELAAGWNMTTADGPIAKQAAEVLRLIFEKNDVFFQRWREVQLDSNRQAELPALDAKIAELEAALNTARQPKIHHFELKPAA